MLPWVHALVGYRGLRSELLVALKKEQPLTAKELGERFRLTPNALRRHLKVLEESGLVRYRRETRGVGGPCYAYSLSEAGEQLFPRAHAATLLDALDYIEEGGGRDAVVGFFHRRWEGMVAETGLEVGGLPLGERASLLAELLTARGYMASAAPDEHGDVVLRKHNCAVREAAERFPELCPAEMRFMEGVLGARLERRSHILSGCNTCEYRVLETSARGPEEME